MPATIGCSSGARTASWRRWTPPVGGSWPLGRAWSPGVSSFSCWAREPEPRAAVSDDLLRSRLKLWFTLLDPVDRRTYLANGLGLMALKYGVDAAGVGLVTGRFWSPLDYLL